MALGDAYATVDELRNRMQANSSDDAELGDVLDSATREVNNHCNRQFNQVTAASARRFVPMQRCLVKPTDFYTDDDLVVETDESGNGTFGTTWSSTDFQLEPLDGVVSGEPDWPFWRIRAVRSRAFPCHGKQATVRVTAKWGWAAVPAPVKTATLIIAAETFKLREAPFGVAGVGEFGVVRVRDNPMAAAKLAPFVRDSVLMA